MAEFLSGYSIQSWLESCPQGYLAGTVYGHSPAEREPDAVLGSEALREQEIRTTVQLVVAERCALAASAGLINCAPDAASKLFLATQTLDEARHVEIFSQRLFDLGLHKDQLEDAVKTYANRHLVEFAELLLEKVDQRDFVPAVVGQNIILEGMALHVFDMMRAAYQKLNPKFARTLIGTVTDERRHVQFGEDRIGSLVQQHPEKKPEIERLQKEMSHRMLQAFVDGFRGRPGLQDVQRQIGQESRRSAFEAPESEWQGTNLEDLSPDDMGKLLANTVLQGFKLRLERLGLEYQRPATT
jgi:1,2-phenylacetyl-CoA epoxidase catalytic subunit